MLDVYQRAYDPLRPVVCIDESSKQLVGHVREPMPAAPGQTRIWDYEYVRNGVADVFMVFEPLGCRRRCIATQRRTRAEFAEVLRQVSDTMYPQAERIVLVMDNLNTHSAGALYEAFEPEEANRLAKRLEIHYTPKHGSWLDMAEIEIGVLMRQCLGGRISSFTEMERQIGAWESERNRKCATVDWQFTTEDARIKLKRLYPKFKD